jgi:hypothetical protein
VERVGVGVGVVAVDARRREAERLEVAGVDVGLEQVAAAVLVAADAGAEEGLAGRER